jgi:hypothetical protein
MRTHECDHWLLVRLAAQNAYQIPALIGAGGRVRFTAPGIPSSIAM